MDEHVGLRAQGDVGADAQSETNKKSARDIAAPIGVKGVKDAVCQVRVGRQFVFWV